MGRAILGNKEQGREMRIYVGMQTLTEISVISQLGHTRSTSRVKGSST